MKNLMRVGVVSDTHGNRKAVAYALRVLGECRVEAILHCGDIDDADTLRLFTGTPAHFILGNCDYEVKALEQAAVDANLQLHGRFAELQLGGKRIALVHGDDKKQLRQAEQVGDFDYLFYGHTHEPEQHRSGRTLVLNPGALYRARPKSFVVLDLLTGDFERLLVPE